MNRENILCELIENNKNLIYKIASKYSNYYNIEDLYQVGVIGIIKAYKKFNFDINTKFSTYAYKYILGEIVDYIKKDRNIIVSDEVFSLYKKYKQVKDLLYNKLERDPLISEICEFMEIDELYLTRIIESVTFTKSLEYDNDYYFDQGDDLINKICINEYLDELDYNDRLLMDYRYFKGYSQCETALKLGVSQVKVSRREKLILSKLKDNISI